MPHVVGRRPAVLKTPTSLGRTGRRAGFTLVEMLAVIAIIVLLMSIAVPAVHVARETARKCVCTSNLRQIATAILIHESSRGALPHGGWSGGNAPIHRNGAATKGKEQFAGWAFQILPQLDEELLHRRPPEVAIATPVSVYFCPSRGGLRVLPPLDNQIGLYVDDPKQGMYAITKAIAHAGIDYASAYCDPQLLDANSPRYADFFDPSPQPETSGCIIRLKISTNHKLPQPLVSLVSLSDIKDGSAHTLLVAEKRMNAGCLGQYQLDDDQGYAAGWDFDVNRNASIAPERDYEAELATLKIPKSRADELRKLSQFGSAHASALNAAFADGSVRTVSYSIDPLVFHRMGRRNDGKTLDE